MIAEIHPRDYMHLQTEIWEYYLNWKYSVMAQGLDCSKNWYNPINHSNNCPEKQ